MKRTYLTPSMTVVKLQHRSFICYSQVRGIAGDDLGYGGASSNNDGGIIRTREYNSVWDDEW